MWKKLGTEGHSRKGTLVPNEHPSVLITSQADSKLFKCLAGKRRRENFGWSRLRLQVKWSRLAGTSGRNVPTTSPVALAPAPAPAPTDSQIFTGRSNCYAQMLPPVSEPTSSPFWRLRLRLRLGLQLWVKRSGASCSAFGKMHQLRFRIPGARAISVSQSSVSDRTHSKTSLNTANFARCSCEWRCWYHVTVVTVTSLLHWCYKLFSTTDGEETTLLNIMNTDL